MDNVDQFLYRIFERRDAAQLAYVGIQLQIEVKVDIDLAHLCLKLITRGVSSNGTWHQTQTIIPFAEIRDVRTITSMADSKLDVAVDKLREAIEAHEREQYET